MQGSSHSHKVVWLFTESKRAEAASRPQPTSASAGQSKSEGDWMVVKIAKDLERIAAVW